MEEFNSIPKAISHKALNKYLALARNDNGSMQLNSDIDKPIKAKEEFKKLLVSWSALSEQLLDTLNKKDSYLTEGKNANSIMAMGALRAHLHLALQAKKESERENQD